MQPLAGLWCPWLVGRWEAPDGFVEFVRDRHAELLRFAHVLTGDWHLAEDLVQDAVERAGVSWRRIRRQDDPEGYVRRTITNRYLNRVRAMRRERLVAVPPAESPSESPVGAGDETDQMWRLLAGLPPKQRAVLVLRYYLDYSEAQAADALSCSVGTVKSNAARGLAKLRAVMQPDRVGGDQR
jgi:RNA polymerase sigma-70 factor (sigma-E family)